MTATGVAAALDLAVKERGAPESITVDNELNARAIFPLRHSAGFNSPERRAATA